MEWPGFKVTLPKLELFLGKRLAAGAIFSQASRNDPGLAETMIKNDEAVIKPDVTIREFQIIDSSPGKFGLNKIFQIIAPMPEATSKRKWKVHFIEQLITQHEALEHMPGISKKDLAIFGGSQFASRSPGAKGEERPGCYKRVASFW